MVKQLRNPRSVFVGLALIIVMLAGCAAPAVAPVATTAPQG